MRKLLKYLIWISSLFLVLIVMVLAITQTAAFRNKLKEQIEVTAFKKLNLKIEIGELRGNLMSTFELRDIHIYDRDAESVAMGGIKLDFKLWALTRKTIQLDSVTLTEPNINLVQDKSGIWSFEEITQKRPRTKKKTKNNKPSKYTFKVDHLEIINAKLSANPYNVDKDVGWKELNLIARGNISEAEISLKLRHASAKLLTPELEIRRISGNYLMNNEGIQVDSLFVLTENSDFDINAEYHTLENMGFVLNANRINRNELTLFIPSLRFKQSPRASIDLNTSDDEMVANFKLNAGKEFITGEINVSPFSDLINRDQEVNYSAQLQLTNVQLENWIETKANTSRINGNIQLGGTNLLDAKQPVLVDANLSRTTLNNIQFDRFEFNGSYSEDSISGNLEFLTEYGELSFSGKMFNLRDIPAYNASIRCKNFQLTTLLPKVKSSEINGNIEVTGEGLKSKETELNARIDLNNSRIYNIPLDSFSTRASFKNKLIDFRNGILHVPGASARVGGHLSLDSLFLLVDADVNTGSLEFLDSLAKVDVQYDSARVNAILYGNVKDLRLGGKVKTSNTKAYGIGITNADAEVVCRFKKDSLKIDVKSVMNEVLTGSLLWDTLITAYQLHQKNMWFNASGITQDSLETNFDAGLRLSDTLTLTLNEFNANTQLSDYFLVDTLKVSLIKSEKLEIRNLELKNIENPNFQIRGDGIISTGDDNKFDLDIQSFRMAGLNRIVPGIDTLAGLVNSNFQIRGSANNPTIIGDMSFTDPRYGIKKLKNLNLSLNYQDQLGKAELYTSDYTTSLDVDFEAPFQIFLDTLQFYFAPPEKFSAKLVADSLSVARVLADVISVDSLSGNIDADIEAFGDFKNPHFKGYMDISDAHYTDSETGIYYDDISAYIRLDGKKMFLDTFLVEQEDGFVSASGELEFDSTIVKGEIVSSSLKADASSFFLTQHRHYEVLLDANTFIENDGEQSEFGGNIYVRRSDIFLPAILPEDEEDLINDTPMLVEALTASGDSSFMYRREVRRTKKRKEKSKQIWDKLTGKISVEIPRNTWIKSDDMRLELNGDVDIVKTDSYFELFGNIDIVRGHYILYGKKLNLQESQFIFQGGEELNPTLNFLAEYIYRDSNKDKRYLELLITGELSEPELTFKLDGAEISETDGISVLIFGATSDEIGYGGQNGIVGSIGTNAVASVITSQLNRTLGNSFKLDMIEVTATENWQSAAFVVGKYITNDIFVIYERGFGETDGDEITPETITVEYELNKKIFLRLQSGSSRTSGVDILLKLEKEREVLPIRQNSPGSIGGVSQPARSRNSEDRSE